MPGTSDNQNLLGIDSVEIEIPEIPDKTYEITVSKKDRKGNLIAGAEMEILKEGKLDDVKNT